MAQAPTKTRHDFPLLTTRDKQQIRGAPMWGSLLGVPVIIGTIVAFQDVFNSISIAALFAVVTILFLALWFLWMVLSMLIVRGLIARWMGVYIISTYLNTLPQNISSHELFAHGMHAFGAVFLPLKTSRPRGR